MATATRGGSRRPPISRGQGQMDSASSVLGGALVLRAADVDVGKARERRRRRRLARLAVLPSVACALAWWRGLSGGSLSPSPESASAPTRCSGCRWCWWSW